MSATDLLEYPRQIGTTADKNTARIRKSSVVVWSMLLMPLIGIVKGTTGFRYGPLLFDILLLVVFLSCLATNLKRRRFDALDALLFSFLVLAFVQMFNPNVPSLQAGIEGYRKFAFMSIAFYLGRRALDIYAIARLQSLLILFSWPIALYGVKQFFHMSGFEYKIIDLATSGLTTYMMGGHLRPFSTLPGPFHLGLYLLVAILWIVTYLLYSSSLSFRHQVLLGCIFLLETFAVFLTRTKSSWFALAGALLFLTLLPRRRLLRRILYAFFVAAVVIGAVMLSLEFLPQDSVQVLRDAIYAVTNVSDSPTFDHREDLWATTIIPAMLRNPWIGYGTSSAGEGLANLYAKATSLYFPSHNLYFKMVLELGLTGLVIFSLITGISVFRGFKLLTTSRPLMKRQILTIIWCMAVVTGFLIAGLAVPVLDAYPANYYFWLLLGVLGKGHGYWMRSVS